MRTRILLLTALLIGACGCESTGERVAREQNREAEASGSPFRWKIDSYGGGTAMTRIMIPLPNGGTRAGPELSADILRRIKTLESEKRLPARKISEVRLLPDGREVWISEDVRGIAYVVTLRASPAGGTDFSVSGPIFFSNHG